MGCLFLDEAAAGLFVGVAFGGEVGFVWAGHSDLPREFSDGTYPVVQVITSRVPPCGVMTVSCSLV